MCSSTRRHEIHRVFSVYTLPFLIEQTGYSRNYLEKIRYGRRPMSGSVREKILQAIEVTETMNEDDLFAPEEPSVS